MCSFSDHKDLMYIRDFEAVQKAHRRVLIMCENSQLCLKFLNLNRSV